jgi:hypothetical protein
MKQDFSGTICGTCDDIRLGYLKPDTEYLEDDFNAAVCMLTDLAVMMGYSRDEVVEKVKSLYDSSVTDKQKGWGPWDPGRTREEG